MLGWRLDYYVYKLIKQHKYSQDSCNPIRALRDSLILILTVNSTHYSIMTVSLKYLQYLLLILTTIYFQQYSILRKSALRILWYLTCDYTCYTLRCFAGNDKVERREFVPVRHGTYFRCEPDCSVSSPWQQIHRTRSNTTYQHTITTLHLATTQLS